MKQKNKSINFFKEFFSIKMISINALVAALYAVLTILGGLAGLSYNFMQFRFSEFLNLLIFFNPSYIMGLTIGCLLANFMSQAGIYDIIFGTLATFVSCLLMIGLSKILKSLFINGLIPSLINALIVPFIIYLSTLGTSDAIELNLIMYFIMFGWVFLGEFLSINVFGYLLFMVMKKAYPNFINLINAKNNLDFKR